MVVCSEQIGKAELPTEDTASRGPTKFEWLIILFGTLLRLTQYLSNRSLWLDEAFLALNIVNRSFLQLLKPLDNNQGAPIGFLMLEKFLPELGGQDLLLITADHGCDPDPRWATTDHSREYVPILGYVRGKKGADLGVRETLADMGQTVAEVFAGKISRGKSFLPQLGDGPG